MQRHIASWLVLGWLFCTLVGIVLLTLGQAMEMARSVASLSNLKQLGTAVHAYARRHDRRLPALQDLETAKPVGWTLFNRYDAATHRRGWTIPGQPGVRYRANPTLSEKKIDEIKDAAKVILFYEPFERKEVSASRGRYVAYADGHAKFIPSRFWPEVARKSGFVPPPDVPFIAPWQPQAGKLMLLLGLETLAVATVLYGAAVLIQKKK